MSYNTKQVENTLWHDLSSVCSLLPSFAALCLAMPLFLLQNLIWGFFVLFCVLEFVFFCYKKYVFL